MSIQLTWHGHATWLLIIDGHRVLIDPFLTNNPSAAATPQEVDADTILVTHGHFDHVDDAAAIANRCGCKVVANFEIATWFSQKMSVANAEGLNTGGGVELPFGRVTMTHALHSSSLPDGSYGGVAGGFLIQTQGRRLYFAGDTGLFSDMKLIARGGLDLAVLPIGDVYTMGIVDSVEAAKLLAARKVMPGHYNTWPSIAQDAEAWAAMVREQTDSEPIVPRVGVPVEL